MIYALEITKGAAAHIEICRMPSVAENQKKRTMNPNFRVDLMLGDVRIRSRYLVLCRRDREIEETRDS